MKLLLIPYLLIFSEAAQIKKPFIAGHRQGEAKGRTKLTTTSRNVENVLSVQRGGAVSLDYRYFVAGGTCAAFSHGITTPIDVIKTKIQAEPEKYNSGMLKAAATIIQEEGASALLAGLAPTLLGYGLEGALKFGAYEVLKEPILKILTNLSLVTSENTAPAFLLSSIVAGAIAAVVLCPPESARIRVVTDPNYSDLSMIQTLTRLIKSEGFVNLFSGVWAMLAKQVPYTMGKQVSFDMFATMFYSIVASFDLSKEEYKFLVSVGAAFLASIFACISSQPGDVILTATYKGEEKLSFTQIVNNVFNEKGFSGFFTGISARLVHVSSIITTQLVIYDVVKQALGLPATGSH